MSVTSTPSEVDIPVTSTSVVDIIVTDDIIVADDIMVTFDKIVSLVHQSPVHHWLTLKSQLT